MATICRRCAVLQGLTACEGAHAGRLRFRWKARSAASGTARRLVHGSAARLDGVDGDDENGTNWSSSSSYPLPWLQCSKASELSGATREPFWNRFAGLFLLRRVARMNGHGFHVSDFLLGVKDAIYALADIVADRARSEDQLQDVLGASLCAAVRRSLDSLPPGAHIHLDVESLRNLHLVAVNAAMGSAEEGDRHVITWLGQKVITSQSKLESLVNDSSGSKFSLSEARKIGMDATSTRLEFQLGVSFRTKEKFVVLDSSGAVVMGANQFRDCFHVWKFSTLVDWDTEDYPFKWSVSDINNFVGSRSNS